MKKFILLLFIGITSCSPPYTADIEFLYEYYIEDSCIYREYLNDSYEKFENLLAKGAYKNKVVFISDRQYDSIVGRNDLITNSSDYDNIFFYHLSEQSRTNFEYMPDTVYKICDELKSDLDSIVVIEVSLTHL